MESLVEIATLRGHSGRVWSVSWNFDGTLLASAGEDKSLKIWQYTATLSQWVCVFSLKQCHSRDIRCVTWSHCGNFLATGGFDSVVYIWQLTNRNPIELVQHDKLSSHQNEVKCVAWSISDQYLASCARDKTVNIYDNDDGRIDLTETLNCHDDDVKGVCWHPLVDILVSCSFDNKINVFQLMLDEWEVTATLSGHLTIVRKVEFNSNGDVLASCSDDKTVRLWISLDNTFSKWLCTSVLNGYHSDVIWDISWASGINLLSSSGRDNSVCVYRIGEPDKVLAGDVSSGLDVELVTKVRLAHDEDVNTCAWRPVSGNSGLLLLATGSDDWSIKLWKFVDPDMPLD